MANNVTQGDDDAQDMYSHSNTGTRSATATGFEASQSGISDLIHASQMGEPVAGSSAPRELSRERYNAKHDLKL